MENKGIDYGVGNANIDKETGIRYGVINQHECLQSWADSSEPVYGDMECSECGAVLKIDDDECPECEVSLLNEFDCVEPLGFVLDDGEYRAECGEDGDIFITKSPYYTLCQFCSPCAPGAGYVMNTVNDGVKAYCFGHDFFDDGKAPYPVYSVKTNELA